MYLQDMYLRALTGYEKAWGPDHISTLATVNNLGTSVLAYQGKMNEAEEMLLAGIDRIRKGLGFMSTHRRSCHSQQSRKLL